MALALDGGHPVRRHDFPAWPYHDDTERAALIRAVDQGQWWRVGGSEITAFEAEFGEYHGGTTLAVTNGTHALELGLELLGLQPGDEVIVPAFTFISTSIAVQRAGGVPVPVDVDPVTYCLDPQALDAVRTPRTRVVIPVHMAGHVADMDAIGTWAARHDIVVFQDAAHAHGAVWSGRRIGDFGTLAAFSFQNGKLMTAGEGGALLLPSAERFDEAFARHSCGRPIGDTSYEHLTPSSNYRMTEFAGAVLRAQLGRLAEQNARRESRWKTLSAALREIPGVLPQGRDPRCELNPHYMAMAALDPSAHPGTDRDLVVRALVAEGIPAFVNYPPVYRTKAHEALRGNGLPDTAELAERNPVSEHLGAHGFWLHHRVLLGTDADCADVAEAVAKVLSELAGKKRSA
ncbi:DegT/DnrJ/EryC1/StrS family aminotransferase [Streptomyces bobili]|uniref:DegT/DnrJ/EryC1/StrS family aminotransferase n=1 Tax=Streptomyces bobili TaxID=67280 RepID=UPI00224F018A|nr:DegT/DnrJ/EryC1/StrS family aminotransferase [Streptomyces bobili]MCX5521428.1 DegT/DnrJ/EryC1/StrS family aminotransferase [Streptomyces bobili]